ncbi:hypothetical protein AAHC03_016605 [Spirometra sp. Aus1]
MPINIQDFGASFLVKNHRSISLQHNWKQRIPRIAKNAQAVINQKASDSQNGTLTPTAHSPTGENPLRALKSLRKWTRAPRVLKKIVSCLLFRLLPFALLVLGLGLCVAGWILDVKLWFSVGCVLSIAALGAGIQCCASHRSTPSSFSRATVVNNVTLQAIEQMKTSRENGPTAANGGTETTLEGTERAVNKPSQLPEHQEEAALVQGQRRHTVAFDSLLEVRRLSLAVNRAVSELSQTSTNAGFGSRRFASYAGTIMLTGMPVLPQAHLDGAFNWQNDLGYYGYPTSRASRLRRFSQWQMPIC